jgi:hypothetical protein
MSIKKQKLAELLNEYFFKKHDRIFNYQVGIGWIGDEEYFYISKHYGDSDIGPYIGKIGKTFREARLWIEKKAIADNKKMEIATDAD